MKETLLYLEDDQSLAFVSKRALEKKGFEVDHFSDIESLRTALTEKPFTCALLDLKIGNDTSIGLIQEIHSHNANIPIVILTGYGTIRTTVKAMKLGAVNVLSKPCGVNEIIQALTANDDEEPIEVTSLETELELTSLKAIERESIQKALDDNDGNISAAARQLKMHRRTLQRKLQKHHVDNPRPDI